MVLRAHESDRDILMLSGQPKHSIWDDEDSHKSFGATYECRGLEHRRERTWLDEEDGYGDALHSNLSRTKLQVGRQETLIDEKVIIQRAETRCHICGMKMRR